MKYKWIKNWINKKTVTGAAVMAVGAATIINASGLDSVFEPQDYRWFESTDDTDNYEYVAGDGGETDLADADRNSDNSSGTDDMQSVKLANDNLFGDTGIIDNTPNLGLSDGNANEGMNQNGIAFVNTGGNNATGVTPGNNGTTVNGGSNGNAASGNGTNSDNGNGGNGGNGNNGDDGNNGGTTEPTWEDTQLKPKDPVMTQYGQLTGLSAVFTKDHYTRGEDYQASDAVVTATFLDKTGKQITKELSYGGSEGYQVSLSATMLGQQFAIFSYKGMSIRVAYQVAKQYVNMYYEALTDRDPNGYYSSTFPGNGIGELYGSDVLSSLKKTIRSDSTYPVQGDLINLSDPHHQMIAYLGDASILANLRNGLEDSRSNIVGIQEAADGYLSTMLTGFRGISRQTLLDEQSYIYYSVSEWEKEKISSRNVVNIIEKVPEGYKIRRETTGDNTSENILNYKGDQTLEGYVGGQTEVLDVPMGVTKIAMKEAAMDKTAASKITAIKIPQSVDTIDAKSITACLPALKDYEYANAGDKNIKYLEYKIVDGILYSADGKTLLSVPPGRKEVTIPDMVTTFAEGCFQGLSKDAVVTMESMRIPKVQGETGFKGTIQVPDSEGDAVRKGYYFAFGAESNQITFTTPKETYDPYVYVEENDILCDKDERSVLLGVNQKTAGVYRIPDAVTEIGAYAFAGCDKLTDVRVGRNVRRFADNSLSIPGNIVRIELLGPGIEISGQVFGSPKKKAGVPNIKIVVSAADYKEYLKKWSEVLDPVYGKGTVEKILQEDEGNVIFEDGAKYIKTGGDKYRLVQLYQTDKTTFRLKEGTTSISEDAFADCDKLEILWLADSLKEVPEDVFSDATALRSVVDESDVLSKMSSTGITEDAEVFEKGKAFADYLYEDDVLYGVNRSGEYTLLCVPTTYDGVVNVKANTVRLYEKAFRKCSKITGIVIISPESLVEIGESCFEGAFRFGTVDFSECTNLMTIGAYAFKECRGMTKLMLPSSLETISEGMCEGAVWLKSVDIKGCREIEDRAFYGCNLLTTVTNMDDVRRIGDLAFANCLNISDLELPESLQEMGESCFENCTSLQNVKLNGTISGISRYCFYGCSTLKSVSMSEQQKQALKIIGVQAFGQCTALEEMELSDITNLILMGERAFAGCTELTTVRLPESLKSLPDYCFEGCENISILILNGKNIPQMGEKIFGDELPKFIHVWVPEECVSDYQKMYKDQLEKTYGDGTAQEIISEINEKQEVVKGVLFEITDEGRILKKASGSLEGEYLVPEDTIRIEADAFSGCQKVTELYIARGTNLSLGDRCFKGCNGLKKVDLRGQITDWGDETFMNCTGIESVRLGATYTSEEEFLFTRRIGTRAFKNCTGLSASGSLVIGGVIENIGEESFAGCLNLPDVAVLTSAKTKLLKIEDRAFADCSKLTVFLTSTYKGLQSIGAYAFTECDSMKGPSIPASVKSIGEGCFMGCDNLTTVSIYGALEEYPKWCFKDCPKLNRTGGTAAAFAGLKRLGEGAYEGCTSLTYSASWNLGKYVSLSEIGANAFHGCKSLPAVTLSSSVTSIGAGAFDGCSGMTSLTLQSVIPPSIGAFSMTERPTGFKILVPDSRANGDNIYQAYLEALMKVSGIGKDVAEEILDSISDGAKERHTTLKEAEEALEIEKRSEDKSESENTSRAGDKSESENTSEAGEPSQTGNTSDAGESSQTGNTSAENGNGTNVGQE